MCTVQDGPTRGFTPKRKVAHLDVPESRARMDWQLALNTLLPRDIRISGRRSCARHVPRTAQCRPQDLRIPPLALQALHAAAALSFRLGLRPCGCGAYDEGSRYLLGKRDFASLKNAGTDLRTTVRTILSITRTPEGPLPEGCLELTWRFEADGFLKQMVRNTMGLLVAVGRGKLEPADIPGILDACDRRIAPLTAPACGLTMKKVWYDDMFPLAASGHEGA